MAMRVLISALAHASADDDVRSVHWVGEVAWPSVPPVGATWVHCGGYDGERVGQVFWCGPGDDLQDQEGYAAVQVVVRASDDVLDHLVADHGFTEG